MNDELKKKQMGLRAFASIMDHSYSDMTKRLLGEYIIEFNKLDLVVARSIWTMLDFNNKFQSRMGKAITSHLMFLNKVEMLNRLVSAMVPKQQREEFKNIYKQLRNCNTRRNELIHSVWYIDLTQQATIYHVRKEMERDGQDTLKDINNNDLVNLKTDIRKAGNKLNNFVESHADIILRYYETQKLQALTE